MRIYKPEDLLELIPQNAIKQCYVTDSPGYNACWDYHVTPAGRHFLACCAEGAFPEYVRLYEYHPESNVLELKFKLDDKIIVYPRAIRPSKLHTGMHTMPNGKIIMTTHTTASAPTHKCWMPEPYYGHMWEGFMGSNVLIYDPETNELEDLGIPVPRESIYGALYYEKEDALLFITYFRGHMYKLDLKTRNVTDFGQITEFGCYLLHEGPDGKVYLSSRSGSLWCYDSEIGYPVYTGIDFPLDETIVPQGRNVLAYCVNGEDGKIYMNVHPHTKVHVYDTKTGTLCEAFSARPREMSEIEYKGCSVFGMQIDTEGVLWYAITTGVSHMGLRLCSVDLNEKNPIPRDHGAIGTVGHTVFCIESITLRDDKLYLPDANGPYSPGVVQIDLETIRKEYGKERVISQDPQCYHVNTVPRFTELYKGDIPLTPENLESADDRSAKVDAEYKKSNHHIFRWGDTVYATRVWHSLGVEGSQIEALEYDSYGSIKAQLRSGKEITVKGGKIISGSDEKTFERESYEAIEEKFADYTFPAHPGRQFLAKASAYVSLADGSTLVGTRDGGVALIRNGKVFSLGMVSFDGGIHAMAVTPDGRFAVGVGGDPSGIGLTFTYDIDEGLNLGGYMYYSVAGGLKCDGTNSASFEPCAVAFSKDGKRLAIGCRDNLGCIYEFVKEN